MIRSTERIARVFHRCGCGNAIRPGDRHIECVASPGDPDLNNEIWWRCRECEECAVRYGRLAPIEAS